jgi:hypothetical protein
MNRRIILISSGGSGDCHMTLYESGSDRQYPHLQIRPKIASKDSIVQYSNKELLLYGISCRSILVCPSPTPRLPIFLIS